MRMKYLILFLTTLMLAVSCSTRKNMPGRRRAPRRCKGCTKWSYTLPADTLKLDTDNFVYQELVLKHQKTL